MIVAAIGAVAIGQIFDGALLIVIFATSGALDDVATKHTADSVTGLLDLTPDRAVVVDGNGSERAVPATVLVVGDRVVVRPGGICSGSYRCRRVWPVTRIHRHRGGQRHAPADQPVPAGGGFDRALRAEIQPREHHAGPGRYRNRGNT
jgi:hypothetical protein